MMRIGTLERALTDPQTVKGGGEKTHCCYDGETYICPISSKEDKKFTHEIAEPWEAE